jgi:toxin YoeB
MRLIFTPRAWEDYRHWQDNDDKIVDRINTFFKECSRTPFAGIGKPEPLRGTLSGWWSRRITQEHRFVYRIEGDALWIAQCRLHY